jgi:hypothetical protein
MGTSTSRPFRYVHPEDILATRQGTDSEHTQLLFTCPMCEQKATFSLIKRIGHCFVCGGIIKLHTTYDTVPMHKAPCGRTLRMSALSSGASPLHG